MNNEQYELMNQKVVQANDLIMSMAKMDKTSLKIFELAVAQIDVENPPENHTIFLSKKNLYSFFDVNDTNRHHRFKEAIEKMQKQAFFVIKELHGKGFRYKSIVPIPYVEWNDYADNVKIRFDIDIMPYLLDLKSNFTQYALKDIIDLNSKYSLIIYKFLSMNYNQFEHYEHTKLRTTSQLESYRNPKISVDELRRITDTLDEYERFQSFDDWVIRKAVKEISEKTHFNVTYEKIKDGRSIKTIQFFIEKKQVAKNEFYKEEQNDEQYAVNKEQQRIKDLEDIRIAISHKYSSKLLHANILTIQDIMSENDLMLELYRTVYDLYFELDTYRLLDTHLEYVAKHMRDYSTNKKNLAKYLRVSAQDYIAKSEYLKSLKE